VSPEIAARLETLGIQLAAQARDYCLFVRLDCLALVHSREGSFTSIGSTGMMTENGLSYLSWRGDSPVLAAHGGKECAATADQVDAIRAFSADLKRALELT